MSQFEILEKSEQTHITEAINQVTSIPCLIEGEINTEEDWNTKVQFRESVNADNVIVWTYDKPEGVTYAVVKAKQDELIAEYDALEWKRKRQSEYPSIEEAVHAILDDDLDNLQVLRQAVKEKFPKNE
jgi:hypothetical protein|tara:strand:- start:76 stop:459 length:384 start_codon:yes stop_codon:yes gene_type:complete